MPDQITARNMQRDRGVYGTRGRKPDPDRMETALREIMKCFEAAAAEGMGDQLHDLPHLGGGLWDIFNRRIEPVYAIARGGLKS